MAEDGLHAALLDNGTVVQNRHAVADFLNHAHLVGDDDDRDAQFAVDLLDQLQDGVGRVGVKGTRRFVAEQHLRVGRQGAGNGNALFLAAGQLGRVGVGFVRQADQLQQFAGAGLGLFLRDLGKLHREHNVAQAGPLHQQVELLEYHRNFAAGGAQVSRIQVLHLFPVDDDAPLVGAFQHIDAAYQRRFSGARHTNDAVDIAIPDGQVDVVQRDDRATLRGKALGQVLQFDHGYSPSLTKIANECKTHSLLILLYFTTGCKVFLAVWCLALWGRAMFAPTTLPRICFFLENGHDRAVISAVDVILDLVAGQGGVQGLDGGVALVAFLHDQNVGVGLGSLRGCVLGGKSILADGEASLYCVVAVDDGKVNVLHGAGQLGSLDFLYLHVMGVLGDVVDGGGQTGAVTHGDQTLSGQQLQGAGLVGGVVGHGDRCAVSDVGEVAALARVDAERLIVDSADADEVGAVLLVEAVEVGGVLEVVSVNLAVLGHKVGLDVIAELNDLKVDALLRQNLLGHIQDLGVGRGGGGDLQGRAGQVAGGLGSLRRSCGALGGGSLRRSGLGGGSGGAAGGQAQGQGSGERCRNQFFHGSNLLFIVRCVVL